MPAALGRVELAQHVAADRFQVALFPELNVAVAAEADPVSEAAAESTASMPAFTSRGL